MVTIKRLLTACFVLVAIVSQADNHRALNTAKVLRSLDNQTFFCRCEYFGKNGLLQDCAAKDADDVVVWQRVLGPAHSLDKNPFDDNPLLWRAFASKRYLDVLNYRFENLGDEFAQDACGVKLDHTSKRIEPPDSRKGDIARIMNYLAEHYGKSLSQSEQDTYRHWAKMDPPDRKEIEVNNWLSLLSKPIMDIPRAAAYDQIDEIMNGSWQKHQQEHYLSTDVELNEYLAAGAEQFNSSIYYVQFLLELGLEESIRSWLKFQDAKKMHELYQLHSSLLKSGSLYFDPYNIDRFTRFFAMAIIRNDQAAMKIYAREILAKLDIDSDFYQRQKWADLAWIMATLIAHDGVIDNELLIKVDAELRPLFQKEFDANQFTKTFHRKSAMWFEPFLLHSEPGDLLQLELIAIAELNRRYFNRQLSSLPDYLERLNLIAMMSKDYPPTKRFLQLEQNIAQLPRLPLQHQAILDDDAEQLALAIKQGAGLNEMDWQKRTPLSILIEYQRLHLLPLLLKRKNDFTDADWKAAHLKDLHKAISKNMPQLAIALIDAGCPVDDFSDLKKPIDTFQVFIKQQTEKIDIELLQKLLEKGMQFRKTQWQSPLDQAISTPFNTENAKALFLLLKQHGLSVKESYALSYDQIVLDPERAAFLIEQGADINKPWIMGKTPLHSAVEESAEETIRLLLKAGARLDLKNDDGETALTLAMARGDRKLIALLQSQR